MSDYTKIVIAGAGAYHFAPALLEDLFLAQRMPMEIWMVDADLDMAELTARAARELAEPAGLKTRFYYTTQLQKAAVGADAVLVCADFLSEEGWKGDFEALDRVGLGKQVRLYGGLGGLFQTLRVGQFLGSLGEQMQKSCPEAPLLLCDNGFGGVQLGRMCDALKRCYQLPVLGLSAVTEQTRERLSLYLDVPKDSLQAVCAGAPSFSFVTRLQDLRSGADLLSRCRGEMAEDSREELTAKLIDLYDAVPAGIRTMQYELLPDMPESPRRTVLYSGIGYADFNLRKRQLAALVAHGALSQEGREAWKGIRESGFRTVRPAKALLAMLGGTYRADSVCMPDPVRGRFVEGPAEIAGKEAKADLPELPIEVQDMVSRITLCNRLYGEAAMSGNRDLLRDALEVDPALTGLDLLYCEEVVGARMDEMAGELPRFYGEDGGSNVLL